MIILIFFKIFLKNKSPLSLYKVKIDYIVCNFKEDINFTFIKDCIRINFIYEK